MDPGSVVLGGMSALILIPKIVNFLKIYGLPDKWIPAVCVALGIGFTFLAEWARLNSNVQWAVGLAVLGFILGLGAMGNRSADNFLEREANTAQLKQTAIEDQTETTATVVANPEGVTTAVEVQPADTPTEPPTVAGGAPIGGRL